MKSLKVLGVAFVAVALLVGVGVASADALTQAEADAIITALGLSGSQADVINALVTGGSSSGGDSCALKNSPNLTVGSSGANVTALQNYLMGMGHSIPAGATGYFGSQTQSALASYQAANGISPAAGYFGPVTRSSINCSGGDNGGSSSSGSSSGGDLSGGAGSVDSYELVSGLNNEEVGEDEEDAEVAGLEIENGDDSDIEIIAVKLDFNQGTGATEDFDEYAEEVSVWFNGKKVASEDADEFDDDNGYQQTLAIDAGDAVIRSDDTEELIVAISGLDNIDSSEQGDEWTVDFTQVRFADAQDSVITEDPGTAARTFSFESFSSAADVEFKARLSGDNPESTVVDVDASDDTDNVELLRFELEAEGNSDLRVRDLPITLTVTGATDVDALANTVYVEIDGEEYSENVSTSAAAASVTFDDFDETIDAEDTVEVVVSVDLNDTGTSGFDEGDTIRAEYTASNRASTDVDDESGESIADSDKTGTALGEDMALYDVSPVVELVSVDESVGVDDGSDDDTGTFTIKYNVTAVDGDVYVSDSPVATTVARSAVSTGSATDDLVYRVDQSGTATTADLSAVVDFVEDGNRVTDTGITNGVKITEGSTAQFTLTVTRTNNGDSSDNGLFRVSLYGVSWASSDTASQNIYDFNLEEYETDYVSLD